jgi:hypothetical protein
MNLAWSVTAWRKGFGASVSKRDTKPCTTIPTGSITDAQLRELLKCLTAKTISYEEMVGGYVKRKTKLAHDFLDVRGDGLGYFCGNGSDPTSVAALVDENKKPVPRPKLP